MDAGAGAGGERTAQPNLGSLVVCPILRWGGGGGVGSALPRLRPRAGEPGQLSLPAPPRGSDSTWQPAGRCDALGRKASRSPRRASTSVVESRSCPRGGPPAAGRARDDSLSSPLRLRQARGAPHANTDPPPSPLRPPCGRSGALGYPAPGGRGSGIGQPRVGPLINARWIPADLGPLLHSYVQGEIKWQRPNPH